VSFSVHTGIAEADIATLQLELMCASRRICVSTKHNAKNHSSVAS